ncbi:serine hydrolase domain-containing protein [Chitinophaga sp. Ak27]|uniref:serine hydrolase domain-containing protein n=1 Tax=Chitinophaga sp. Ak27 TaxID=2726116 RepID=UPI00145EFBE8|nr:serine hydrolase domain-containing protein [Chitinophaga sp. Ak27]NLU91434.1 beta-lactamase family protein [Chitinophaga sp. Ak27]
MRILITGIICLAAAAVFAQGRDTALKAYFDSISAHHLYDGNIALTENGHKVYAFSDGYADYATGQRNTMQSRFNLASISKIFTATAILQLRDKKQLRLEDPVTRYLPGFPFPGITIRHLLTHTSGLPDLELYEEVVKQYPDSVITNAAILPLLRQWNKELYFTPGDQFRYCNTNFSLLALIVEKITGSSFPAYLEKHIFKPAGMKDTYVAVYGSSNFQDSLRVKQQVIPALYDSAYTDATLVKRYRYSEYNNQASIGPSNVITTADDMIKFDNAYFSGKLLKLSTVEEAITPLKLNNGKVYTEHMDTMLGEGTGQYGLGWDIFIQPGYGKGVGHGGFKFGLATFYYHHLARKQVVIAYTNGNSRFGENVTSCFYMLNHQRPMPLDFKKSAVRAYANALITGGADHAACMLHLYKADTSHYYFNTREMNFLGYDFLYQCSAKKHQQWSLETFKLNTFLDPGNFNTYDSYGEALLETGYREDAVRMYRKSLELNPNSADGLKAMKKLGLL